MVEPIGYVLRKFPVLSETFILNEILSLEERGIPVHIFALERPNDPKFHANLAKLKASVTYIPDLSNLKSLWMHYKNAKRHFPEGFSKAQRYALSQLKPTLFLRFLQSCYVANHARKLKIKHFHSHFATRPTSIVYFTSILTGKPYSFTAHAVDIFKTSLSEKALKRKIGNAKFVITVSDFNKSLLSKLSDRSDKIHLVHNGIDLNRFLPFERDVKEPFTFLCVARLVEKKGHSVLIEACRQLRDAGHRFRCICVGEGRLKGQIEEQIKKYDLQDCVKLLGAHSSDEVLVRYHESDAFVLPCCTAPDGNKDGLPVSMIEALACGLPVITTPMTGNPEVITNDYNGHLVNIDDARDTATAMERLLIDQAHYLKLKNNARSSVMEKFCIKTTSNNLFSLFEETKR